MYNLFDQGIKLKIFKLQIVHIEKKIKPKNEFQFSRSLLNPHLHQEVTLTSFTSNRFHEYLVQV